MSTGSPSYKYEPPKVNTESSSHEVIKSGGRWKVPVLIGIPTLGQVRFEWANAIWNSVIPVNWASSTLVAPIPSISAMTYHVAEAQNMIVAGCLEQKKEKGFEFLLLLEDDVVPPPDIFIKFKRWVEDGRFPIVSGLYNLKGENPEPLVFRGRGNGTFKDFKLGEVVWADGVPTGCLLIHTRLLEVAWEESPVISLTRVRNDGSVHEVRVREVFKTLRDAGVDPETGGCYRRMGTSDLDFCDRVLDNRWLQKAGFKEAAEMKYPFPVDTSIYCGHIDLTTGNIY